MFEFGMRLGREVRTRLGLQKQVNCYLAALNCLRLIRPEYAWIVQPVSGSTVRTNYAVVSPLHTGQQCVHLPVSLPQYGRPGASPKRNSDGDFPAEPGMVPSCVQGLGWVSGLTADPGLFCCSCR